MIGTTVLHYKILEKLGEGGMGVVYRAHDTKLDRDVALKFLPPELTRNPEAKERFIHEAQAASALDHTNICTIFEFAETDKRQLFIAMSCYEGEILKKKIERGPLQADKIINIGIQIAQGLEKAHEKGIVHRDMKPANIMITKEEVVKILDFGLAKLSGRIQHTKAGTTLGTVAYMSPEQARGLAVDHRTDIWSFGVILYEMFAGKPPFRGEYDQSVIYSIINDEPQSLASIRADIPDGTIRVIEKCLEKNPDRRFESVTELIRDLQQPMNTAGKHKELPSIAVLPFRDMSPAHDQEYFCEGIAEELINDLAQIEGLHVVARTSAFQFNGKDLDVRQIGKELGVKSVLEGSVRKAGERLRITAQLINVSDGYHLWSEKYDRDLEDIFAIQDEISMAIVKRLRGKLLADEKSRIVKRYTENEEAHNLYLKGLYFWNRRYEGGLQKGIEYFQQAIAKDPLYALAYVGIADCYNQLGLWDFLPPKEAYPKAKAACSKALDIDDSLAEAYASLGWVSMFYDWNWEEAEKVYKRSIELNPRYATVRYYYSLCLGALGRSSEAISEAKKGVDLDPLSLVNNVILGFELYLSRRFDEAVDQLNKTLEMDSNFAVTSFFLGLTYMGKKKWEEAIAFFKKYADLWQGNPFPIGFLGYAYGMSGQEDNAKSMLDQLSILSRQRYVPSYFKALIFTGMGKNEQAFEYFNNAFDERESWMVSCRVGPYMDPLRSDPRHDVLIKKIGI